MSTDQDIIVTNAGDPFKTEAAARSQMRIKGLPDTSHDVVPHNGGFAIKRKDNNPTPQQRAAVLGEADPGPHMDGPEAHTAIADRVPGKERFFWTRFHDKSRPSDPQDVELGCNGEVLQIQRNQWVILPERFVEVAQHAEYPQYALTPGNIRKQIGTIKVWPFDIGKEATREEYDKMLRAGTEKNKQAHDM